MKIALTTSCQREYKLSGLACAYVRLKVAEGQSTEEWGTSMIAMARGGG